MDNDKFYQETFETWVKSQAVHVEALEKNENGFYQDPMTEIFLRFWQESAKYHLKGLREAYEFYKKAKKDPQGGSTGAVKDGIEWVFKEVEELFSEISDKEQARGVKDV